MGAMKTSTRPVLLPLVSAAALFLSACQSASFDSTPRFASAAVPVVLQANPDLLGGLVGREAIGSLPALGGIGNDTQTQRAELDRRAYLIWKNSERS
jgi:hypothetical protein